MGDLNKVLMGTESTWSTIMYFMYFLTVAGHISLLGEMFDNKQMSDK